MARTKFRELYNARPAEARARVEARVRQALAEMPTLENESDDGCWHNHVARFPDGELKVQHFSEGV